MSDSPKNELPQPEFDTNPDIESSYFETPAEGEQEKPKRDASALPELNAMPYAQKAAPTYSTPRQTNSGMSSSTRTFMIGCFSCFALLICICCIVPMACFGIFAVGAAIAESNEVTENSTEILEVVGDDTVNLEVVNSVGETSIRGEPGVRQIEIDITKRATGLQQSAAQEAVDNLDVQVRRQGSRYIIEVNNDGDDGLFIDPTVDLRITVPTEVNITATSDVGSITVRDIEIVSELELESSVGEIDFEGKIGPRGIHRVASDVGSIEIQVTNDSSFRLDASSDVGSVDVDLNLRNPNRNDDGVGGSVTGDYGQSPDATLRVSTDVGSITLRD